MQADNNWAEISTDQKINAEGFLEWKPQLLLDYSREGEKVSERGMEDCSDCTSHSWKGMNRF